MSPHFTRVVKEVYGYKNVRYMVAGHKTWQATIQPYYTEPEFLKLAQDKNIAHILIDLRSKDKAEKEHIKGAVNFPVGDDLAATAKKLSKALPSMEDPLHTGRPMKEVRKSRIIYYADNPEIAEQIHRIMRANYWENAYILNGGIKAWKAKGYPVESGPLTTKILYKGTTALPGSMPLSKFEEIALATPADTVILDVRSPSEWASTGIVPGSMTIPIDTMHRRYTEVPKDKKIIVFCAAGNRALQVWRLLGDKGYKNVRWLDGKPTKSKKGIFKKGIYGN